MRLLVAEDDVKLARALAKGMRHEGYAVDLAETGDEALAYTRVWDYDAIVLDVMLPGRDGFEVCRELRTGDCRAPVLMLTARRGVTDRITGLDAGADDYLVKPFDFGELLARVRALVRRGPRERPLQLEVGDLLVDPATRTVTRDGEAVELTPREFALIEFMAAHPGEVLSRARLIDHVWDMNYTGSTNIVDVYVGHLRRKLEQPFGRPLIRTVRGIGFTLEPEE
ncbi:MAG TPA: response regulator transcription factor [Thermoleophilaceae bacterium]|nr:response regulator transcription factor [Thermoleophilaceae bacterium]